MNAQEIANNQATIDFLQEQIDILETKKQSITSEIEVLKSKIKAIGGTSEKKVSTKKAH